MPEIMFKDAIRDAILEEMELDERVYVLGENCSQDCWGMSDGLLSRFGRERIRNTAISEAAIIGSAVGAALAGYRPVANMMFVDFIMCGADEALHKAGKWRFAHGGQNEIPLVLLAPCGGYSKIGPEHSQVMESFFMRNPGIKIAMPSNPYDAKGLLKTAIRDNNPVVFLPHKSLMGMVQEIPGEEYLIPFGKAEIKKTGTDVTVVVIGYLVQVVLEVANVLEKEHGISIEVIDPRTLEPFDLDTVVNSVKKTKRAVLVDEDTSRCGATAEIGMLLMENAFDYLDAPVARVAAANYPIAAGALEQYVLPQPQWIADAIAKVCGITRKLDVSEQVKLRGGFG